jgi:RNA recognition motif-containing protein
LLVKRGACPDGSTLQKEQTMSTNLYVGNLTFDTTSSDLETLFASHGQVKSAQVITDRESGRSRGFGFVEMSTPAEAKAAIDSLNGHNMDGRQLTVNVAKERRS